MLDEHGVEITKEEVSEEEELGTAGYVSEPVKQKKPVPGFIFLDIAKIAIISGFLFLLSLYFCISGQAKWYLALVTFIVMIYFGWDAYVRYDALKYEEYVRFEGFVSSVTKKGFGNNRYYMVKIIDETGDKDLNFFYKGTHQISPGEPVTLYISDKERVYSTSDGPTINSYIGVEFSIISEEEQESISSGGISDYMKSKG